MYILCKNMCSLLFFIMILVCKCVLTNTWRIFFVDFICRPQIKPTKDSFNNIYIALHNIYIYMVFKNFIILYSSLVYAWKECKHKQQRRVKCNISQSVILVSLSRNARCVKHYPCNCDTYIMLHYVKIIHLIQSILHACSTYAR